MRKAGLLVWKAHQVAEEMVRPGATTKAIDAAVEDLFDSAGAVGMFKGVPGRVPFPAVTCMSVNEEVVHGIPSDRALREGDILSLDTGCRLAGWCGDACVTHKVGKVVPEVDRLVEVTRGTLALAIDAMATAQYWSEVAEQMEKFVCDAGFFVVEDFVGHGIGREMHEAPQVPNFSNNRFRRLEDFRLQPGVVIAIEPMVNLGTKRVRVLSDHWTQVTYDREPSAHFEHTVAMTEKGPWVLTGAPETEEELAFVAKLGQG